MLRSQFEHNAILELAAGAVFRVDMCDGVTWEEVLDDEGEPTGKFVSPQIHWYSENIPMPSKEAIKAKADELQAAWQSTDYQRQRRPEYPPITDLADALYWQAQGDDSKMTAYLAAVEAVKQKYPKGV